MSYRPLFTCTVMSAESGLYWIEVDGTKYVFRNHYLRVSEVYEAVDIILKEMGGPVKLLDECPPALTTWIDKEWNEIESPPLSAFTDQHFFPFQWE